MGSPRSPADLHELKRSGFRAKKLLLVPPQNIFIWSNACSLKKPTFAGITLPRMPVGAPGMGRSENESFEIYALGDGPPNLQATE
jgi:hypothetical protein